MKLANVHASEIAIEAVFVFTCFMCNRVLYIGADVGTVADAAGHAAAQGWHSYDTPDESCACACPSCIKEVMEVV